MKYSYFGCLFLLLFFWFLGVVLYLPGTQRDLALQTRELLDAPKYDGVFAKVTVAYAGQEAILTGAVATAEEKKLLQEIVGGEVRLRDQQPQRNPVIAVNNRVEVNPDAAPLRRHPWLLVAVHGSQKRMEGVVKDPGQRQALLAAMETQWPAVDAVARQRGNQMIVDERCLPIVDWAKSLETLPDFSAVLRGKEGVERAMVAVSMLDGAWQVFPPTASDDEIAAALSGARVTEQQVALALNDLRIRTDLKPEDAAKE